MVLNDEEAEAPDPSARVHPTLKDVRVVRALAQSKYGLRTSDVAALLGVCNRASRRLLRRIATLSVIVQDETFRWTVRERDFALSWAASVERRIREENERYRRRFLACDG